jgi:NAD(P)-dependent dehydrogenase (short-subunit alcohol dehydrogenase family)
MSSVALVTGAARGIGLATARLFLREGWRVALLDIDRDGLAGAVAGLERPDDTLALPCDVADEAGVSAAVAAVTERFGRLDALVNNAGIGVGAAVDEHQTKFIDLQLDVNVRAMILFYRECAELLKTAGAEHGQAQVINTASIAGKSGQAWLSVYSATKFAVVGFTQSMNKELGTAGVKSTAFCPGFVDTDMTDFVKDNVPADEMIKPEDIGETVRLLLRLSPACVIPEVVFQRPNEVL